MSYIYIYIHISKHHNYIFSYLNLNNITFNLIHVVLCKLLAFNLLKRLVYGYSMLWKSSKISQLHIMIKFSLISPFNNSISIVCILYLFLVGSILIVHKYIIPACLNCFLSYLNENDKNITKKCVFLSQTLKNKFKGDIFIAWVS